MIEKLELDDHINEKLKSKKHKNYTPSFHYAVTRKQMDKAIR